MITRAVVCVSALSMVALLTACERPAREPAESPAPADRTATVNSEATPPMPDASTMLPAYEWRLSAASNAQGESIEALLPAAGRFMALRFADGRIGVHGGCNRMSGAYTLAGDQLEIGSMASTQMACPPPLENADRAMSEALSGTLTLAIEGETQSPTLRLVSASGSTLVLQGTPTPETRFSGPGERMFLEVAAEPGSCGEGFPPERRCPQVRERKYDDAGLAAGEPGPWRPLTTQIEGYAPTEGERHVLRVKRFERAGAAGAEPEVHFVLDMIVERERVDR